MALSPKQKLFVQEYLIDLNATRAAKAAKYSKKTAHSQGPRLLENVEVADAIQQAMDKRAKKAQLTADEVLQDLAAFARFDFTEAFDGQGNLLPPHEIPKHLRQFISGVRTKELWRKEGNRTVKDGEMRDVKFIDKLKAYELIGRHLKLFTDKVEHSGDGNIVTINVTMPDNGRSSGSEET